MQEKEEYNGIHLLDTYHILHNIRKRLKEKNHIVYFKRLIHAKNQGSF